MSCNLFELANASLNPAGTPIYPAFSTYPMCCVSVLSRMAVMPKSQCSTSPF